MKIGIVGLGSIGRRHVANLQAMGETDIVSHDILSAHAYAGAGYGTHFVSTLDELWETKPEAVLICTPPNTHADMAHEAVWQGVKAIFIEKPLGARPAFEEWLRFLTSPQESITMVACNWRFHPGPLALKRWLDEGVIGDVLSARISMGYYLPDTKQNYKDSYAATTGVTLDVGSHAVDLAVWLLGPACLRSAVVRPADSIGLKGTDGLAELLLEHKSGAVSSVHVNWLQKHRDCSMTVVGTTGEAGWNEESAWMLDKSNGLRRVISAVDSNTPYRDQLAHFLACACENKSTCNPVSSAVDVLKILLEAKQCGR